MNLTYLHKTNNDELVYELILPACLEYVPGSILITNVNGVVLGVPDVETVNQDTVLLTYSANWGATNAIIAFDVIQDCNQCSAGGTELITVNSFYTPDLNCGCQLLLGCIEFPIELLCPVECEGANLLEFSAQRINFGLPDNNNDGVIDPTSAILDTSLVSTNKLMFGDTLGIVMGAYVSNPNNLNWYN